MLVVGIDVGGTNIKLGLIEDGKIIRTNSLSTNAFDVIRQVANGIRELVQSEGRSMSELNGVGLGFPGMIIDNVVKDSPNIGLQDCNLKEVLEQELGVSVVVRNDADMAAIAECKIGAGENCNNMVFVCLGTGVGGGIIINGSLYEGNGGAGEVGHISIEPNGRPCTCGRKGCAEQYVSMIALSNLAKEMMVGYPDTKINPSAEGDIYASELVRAYKLGDACAMAVVNKYVGLLSQYLLSLCNLFRPEKVVVGGGITHAPEIIEMVAKACKEASYGYKNSPAVDIVPARLGNEAGILGAAVCFEDEVSLKVKSSTNEDVAQDNEVSSVEVISAPEVDIVDTQPAEGTSQEDDIMEQLFAASAQPESDTTISNEDEEDSVVEEVPVQGEYEHEDAGTTLDLSGIRGQLGNLANMVNEDKYGYQMEDESMDIDTTKYDADLINRLNEKLNKKD